MSNSELWLDISGYEGYYQISNLGRVKSLARTFMSGKGHNIEKNHPERILVNKIYKTGYKYIALSVNGIAKKFKIHRLVAMAFIPNLEGKPCVDHIDAVRGNNMATNLRWATTFENMSNSFTLQASSRSKLGSSNPSKINRRRFCKRSLETNEILETFIGVKETAGKLGIDCGNLSRTLRRENNTAYGFRWEYLD